LCWLEENVLCKLLIHGLNNYSFIHRRRGCDVSWAPKQQHFTDLTQLWYCKILHNYPNVCNLFVENCYCCLSCCSTEIQTILKKNFCDHWNCFVSSSIFFWNMKINDTIWEKKVIFFWVGFCFTTGEFDKHCGSTLKYSCFSATLLGFWTFQGSLWSLLTFY
jgi:hypothetical protein